VVKALIMVRRPAVRLRPLFPEPFLLTEHRKNKVLISRSRVKNDRRESFCRVIWCNVISFSIGPVRLKRSADQFFHDFVRAAINGLDPGISIHARDGVFLHIACAAVQLQTHIDDLVLFVRCPILSHGCG